MTISTKVIGFVVAALSVLFVSACDDDHPFGYPVDNKQTTPDDNAHGDGGGGHHG
ncbi:hypothetical protein [Profundibacter amoris]|uniref:hypothetical protein n=1 Tax=Profundibacter amoris TaxID=2171755 RepID=UPI0013C2EFDB|nr:hypothetical protein [Profundibacter amoris]